MSGTGVTTDVRLDSSQNLDGDFYGGSTGDKTVNFADQGSPWYVDLIGGGISSDDNLMLYAALAVVVVLVIKKKKGK